MSELPHVLVAEDDADMRGLLATELERAGYRVTTVADGGEAAEILELSELADTELHGVVLDIRMPEATGVELLRWLRGEARRIPVVLISGCIEGVEAVGATNDAVVLAKPFSRAALASAIEESRRLVFRGGAP